MTTKSDLIGYQLQALPKDVEQVVLSDEFRKHFVIDLKGKDFIIFDGLIFLAHARGMTGIQTEVTKYPFDNDMEMAVVHAIVKDKDGNEWHGTGDAAPTSVGKTISNAVVRMAETRAIGRALRMMLGVGTMLEEVYNPFEEAAITDNQIHKISSVMKRRGFGKDDVKALCKRTFNKIGASSLTASEASALISMLESIDASELDGQDLPAQTNDGV